MASKQIGIRFEEHVLARIDEARVPLGATRTGWIMEAVKWSLEHDERGGSFVREGIAPKEGQGVRGRIGKAEAGSPQPEMANPIVPQSSALPRPVKTGFESPAAYQRRLAEWECAVAEKEGSRE